MQKWEVIRIYCDHLPEPHDKFCICICPENRWFMFINSRPPMYRKARDMAVSIESHEALFLGHLSFVDTTKLQDDIPDDLVDNALGDPNRNHGVLAPFVRNRIIEGVGSHEVMEPNHRAKVIEG
ncbi:MAG: hypothetical protein CML67_05755 [Rhodobacteraceae bacterium]|nr:hypothetical protein [Paracoccaceae bacterium]